MEIDEKEVRESLKKWYTEADRLIVNCIESVKKPDALAEKVELNEEAVLKELKKNPNYEDELSDEMFNQLKYLIEENDRESITEMMRISVNFTRIEDAKTICAKFRPANVDALEAENKRLRDVLGRVQADINWMLNNKKFLNADVFDYLEQALGGKTEGEK